MFELTTVALERHKLANRLRIAGDGAEALDRLIGRHAEKFAFVLLDLKLPKTTAGRCCGPAVEVGGRRGAVHRRDLGFVRDVVCWR
jgi:hypothetical protein